MNKHVLYFFRKEMEKEAFLAGAGAALGLGGAKAGLYGMRTFNPLTKMKNLTPAQQLLRKSVQGNQGTLGGNLANAYGKSRKLTNASTNLIHKSVNNQETLNRAGDIGLDLIM